LPARNRFYGLEATLGRKGDVENRSKTLAPATLTSRRAKPDARCLADTCVTAITPFVQISAYHSLLVRALAELRAEPRPTRRVDRVVVGVLRRSMLG
jgi:hypothetical protein